MNKILAFSVPVVIGALVLLAFLGNTPGIKKQFEAGTGPQVRIGGSNTYSNSAAHDTISPKVFQTDTLIYNRPAGLSGALFSVYFGDSVKILNVIMRRVIGGIEMAAQAGDTVVAGFAGTAATHKFATLTLAPLPDAYRFYVRYDTAANGVTSPTVSYIIEQQFYDR